MKKRDLFVNVTIPVFNEEARLGNCIATLHQFLTEHFQFDFEIVIANNGSTDRTQVVAEQLCARLSSLSVVRLPEKGRGRALRQVWSDTDASIPSYMDCDLSTKLEAFPRLIEALIGGRFDVATGSRILKHSLTTRGFKRELISRCYNRLVKTMFRTGFSDAQCGFKAITKQSANVLLPLLEDTHWFMDTELLVIAEKFGYRICDLPVQWVDDSDSRVKVFSAAIGDLRGLIRLHRRFAVGELRIRSAETEVARRGGPPTYRRTKE